MTIQTTATKVSIPAMLATHNLTMSQAEARRLINNRAIKLNGEIIEPGEYYTTVKFPAEAEIGKHRICIIEKPRYEYTVNFELA